MRHVGHHVEDHVDARVTRPLRQPGGIGETIVEGIDLVRQLRLAGLDVVNVSLGISTPDAKIPWDTPAFMAPVAERARREAGVLAAIGWGMGDTVVADAAVRRGHADLVLIGRALLANPHCPFEAATALGLTRPSWTTLPPQ